MSGDRVTASRGPRRVTALKRPGHLARLAQQAWSEITDGLGAEQVTGVERPALEAYAVQVARMRDAQARIDAEGLIVADEKGRPVEHPAVRVERYAQEQVRAWVARYRPRVVDGSTEGRSTVDDLAARRASRRSAAATQ